MGIGQMLLAIGPLGPDPLAASVSPTYDYASIGSPGTATSASISCSATGGSETGYTYTWTYVSGDATITPNSGSSSSTTFSTTFGLAGLRSAVYKCVVDDSLGNGPVDSNTVTIELEYVI